MKKAYIDRDITALVKGVALILMFAHHFFFYPDWYVSGISYPGILPFVRYFQNPTKICVVVFAFITGYFYHFTREKTIRHSLGKIGQFLVSYWAALAILMIPAVALGCCRLTPALLIGEVLGLDQEVMIFCWYVSFYVISMLVLPVLAKLSPDRPGADLLLVLVLPGLAVTVVRGVMESEFGLDYGLFWKAMTDFGEWFPCVGIGYLCAKYSLFENYLDGLFSDVRHTWAKMLFWLLMCTVGFFGKVVCNRFLLGSIQVCGDARELWLTMDIVYGPMFVYGLVNILKTIKTKWIRRPLAAVGNKSMYMWFFHCVFFNCCKELTQPVLYALKNPLLVMLAGLGICYLAAVAVDVPMKKLRKKKKAVG